jgi:hypothetical protein
MLRHKFLLLLILGHWLAQRLENLTQLQMPRKHSGKPNSRKGQGFLRTTLAVQGDAWKSADGKLNVLPALSWFARKVLV